MASGAILDARFLLLEPVGRGGMGEVWRARDLAGEAMAAVKIMDAGANAPRFVRESAFLASLSHPALVRYIAQGVGPDGRPFLAMEWLEGEPLDRRLLAGPLSIRDAVTLARRIAEGLGAAHAAGVVHRDVKPSNVMLCDRDVGRAKVIDFGVAWTARGTPMTRSGALVGTVGYMAPEQAAAEAVDARSDCFALGCVLHECLTGMPAFSGPNLGAVLVKALRCAVPSVLDLRRDVPRQLAALVERLLAKDPAERPANGAEAARLLAALEGGEQLDASAAAAPHITRREQRFVSLLCVRTPEVLTDATLTYDGSGADAPSVITIAARFGAEAWRLADGSALVSRAGGGLPLDEAATAARCALALAGELGARVAIASGFAVDSGSQFAGSAVDRAAALIDVAGEEAVVVADAGTVALLEGAFVIEPRGDGGTVLCARAGVETRRVLGKATPFVGREKELALLGATFAECAAEPVARVVIVTGEAGVGKSRLAHELAQRLPAGARRLSARADVMGAGSSLAVVRALIRAAAGIDVEESAALRYDRLLAHVTALVPGDAGAQVAELLGEVVGVPTPREPSALLRAARGDPAIMREQLERALLSWLEAECATPLLIVLEDLHWGDEASARLFATALRALAARPVMLLALARPEVHDVLPNLWHAAEPQEVRLGALTRSAGERLVRAVLGDRVEAAVAARLAERAGGNALYLEELIRATASDTALELPETVLAMAQARLGRLDPEARRVLRAASALGESFWPGAVAAISGCAGADVEAWLRVLEDREVIDVAVTSRFAGERERTFRHALLRDAAYATLTEDDRARAHALAAEWLERAGERDAVLLARHHELGRAYDKAARWLLPAAEAAIDAGALESALELAQRGLALGAGGELGGGLLMACASSYAYRHRHAELVASALAARKLLQPGSTYWWLSTGGLMIVGKITGPDPSLVAEMTLSVLDPTLPLIATGPCAYGAYLAAATLSSAGALPISLALVDRMEAALGAETSPDIAVWLGCARTIRRYATQDFRGLEEAERAIAGADVYPALRKGLVLQFLSPMFRECGDYARYRAVLEESERALRSASFASIPRAYLAFLDVVEGAYDRARELGARVLAEQDLASIARQVASITLAACELAGGDPVAAEHALRAAIAEPVMATNVRGMGLPFLCRALLAQDRADAALAEADDAIGREASSTLNFADAGALRLARVEALDRLGRGAEADAALAEACDRIERMAASIAAPERRAAYLGCEPHNAATLALARRLGA